MTSLFADVASLFNDALGDGFTTPFSIELDAAVGHLATRFDGDRLVTAATARLVEPGDAPMFELVDVPIPPAPAWMERMGCRSAWAAAWPSGEPRDSRALLTAAGFVVFAEAAFWRHVPCPRCGADCHCVGALMGRPLGRIGASS